MKVEITGWEFHRYENDSPRGYWDAWVNEFALTVETKAGRYRGFIGEGNPGCPTTKWCETLDGAQRATVSLLRKESARMIRATKHLIPGEVKP